MTALPPLGRLHVLTDARDGRDPLPGVAASLAAGAPAVQVRTEGSTDRELYDLASRVAALCAETGSLCVVNDRPDVALAVGARGTHLGADDLPVDVVSRLVGPGHHVGGTARDPDTARALVAQGASYLGVGPTFATRTKAGLPDPLGVDRVGEVARAADVPVLAIGGVTAAAVPALLAAGVYGVAVVAAVSASTNPGRATAELLAALAAAS